jgi:hypothetical protein
MDGSAAVDDDKPATNDLNEVVAACFIVEAEMKYQVKRLDSHVKPRTKEEQRYLDDTLEAYRIAEKAVRRLRRYHSSRMERHSATGSPAPEDMDDTEAIVNGKATAYSGDEE